MEESSNYRGRAASVAVQAGLLADDLVDGVPAPAADDCEAWRGEHEVGGLAVCADLQAGDGRLVLPVIAVDAAVFAAGDEAGEVSIAVVGEAELDDVVFVLVAAELADGFSGFDVEERDDAVEAAEEAEVAGAGEAALGEGRRVGEDDGAETLAVVDVPDPAAVSEAYL